MSIAFTKVKLPFGWLGNMAPFPIEWDGRTWPTSEALFQALRFKDESIQEEIRGIKNPMQAKFLAKKYADRMVVSPKSEQDVQNMVLVVRLKVEQYPNLKKQLMDTGDEVIVEDITSRAKGGNHDFWGAALVNGQWEGTNALGKIWMNIRKSLH